MKIVNIGIGIYFANLKKDNTKSLLCFLKEFFPPGGGGEKVCRISLFNMTSVE